MKIAVVIFAFAIAAVSADSSSPSEYDPPKTNPPDTNWTDVEILFRTINETIFDSMTVFVNLTSDAESFIADYVANRKWLMNYTLASVEFNIEHRRLNQKIAWQIFEMVHYCIQEQMFYLRLCNLTTMETLEEKFNETSAKVIHLNHKFLSIIPPSPMPDLDDDSDDSSDSDDNSSSPEDDSDQDEDEGELEADWRKIRGKFHKIRKTIMGSMNRFVVITAFAGIQEIMEYVGLRREDISTILDFVSWNIKVERIDQEIAFQLFGMIHCYVEEQMYIFRQSALSEFAKYKLEERYSETSETVMKLNRKFFKIIRSSPMPTF